MPTRTINNDNYIEINVLSFQYDETKTQGCCRIQPNQGKPTNMVAWVSLNEGRTVQIIWSCESERVKRIFNDTHTHDIKILFKRRCFRLVNQKVCVEIFFQLD